MRASLAGIDTSGFRARDEDRQQALQAGFQLNLAKPVDARSQLEAVATLGRFTPT